MRFLAALFLAWGLAAPAAALTPPWYHVHAQLRHTFEGGPIKVLDLEQHDGRWVVPFTLSGPHAFECNDGLATVLKRTFLSGTVWIEVRLPDGTRGVRSTKPVRGPDAAVRSLKAALRGNPHVSGIHAWGAGALVECKPHLIQFFADNLNDRNGYAHFLPGTLFEEYLDFSPFTDTRVSISYELAR